MTLMDINGDGLADKVYIKNDSIYYRKQVFSDTISFFSTEQNTGIPAKSLNHDVSKTHQWGLQAGAAVPGEVAGANISGGWSITDTQTSSYFADVNGDGLPDYIDNGTIYFNTLKYSDHFIKHNGEYLIQTDTSDCSSYFYYDGSVVLGQDCYVDYVLVDSFSVNPDTLHDHCENCELLSRLYLYGGDDYSYLWWEAAECSRYCNMDLACREWEWYSDNDDLVERCEQYQDLCSRCLWSYLHYGEESEEYQSCRDYFCIFKGQRMVCDTCRERCIEDSVDCEACIEENCAYIEMYDDNELYITYMVYLFARIVSHIVKIIWILRNAIGADEITAILYNAIRNMGDIAIMEWRSAPNVRTGVMSGHIPKIVINVSERTGVTAISPKICLLNI